MAIKFSQFITQTSASSLSHIVGYNGADNIQITPADFFTSFAVGSAGQVSFFDTTSSLAGSNQFVWDNTNKRLGIGTINPNRTLHIATDSGVLIKGASGFVNAKISLLPASGGRQYDLGNVGSDFRIFDASAGVTRMYFDNDGNTGIGTTTPSSTLQVSGTLDASGISQLGSGGANVYLTSSSAGNVGIGTSSPGAKLNVAGDVLINSGEYISWGTVGATSIEGSTASNKLQFRTGSSDRMIINNTGVGIGTTSPTSLLEISKQLSAVSTIDYPYTISSRDDGNSIDQQGGEGVGIKFRIAGNAATTPGNSLVGASIAAIRESDSDADSSTGLGLFVTQNNETLDEALRIDHDGNVGIGTSSPAAGLQVAKGGSTIPAAGSSTASAVFGNSTSDDNYGVAIGANSSGVGYISSQRTDGAATTYNLAIQPNGGNVGIGTTSPYAQLSVKDGTDINLGIKFGQTDPTAVMLNAYNDAVTANIPMEFRASKFNFENGNVGIGTSAPAVKLHVEGGNSYTPIRFDGSGNYQGYLYNDGGGIGFKDSAGTNIGNLIYIHTAANNIRLFTNGSEKMRIDSSGNVGIGTTSPGAKLEVAGDIKTSGDIIIDNSSGDPFLKLKSTAQEYVLRIDQSDSEKFQIRNTTSSVTALSIDTSSNVTFAGDILLSHTGSAGQIIRTTDNNEPYFALQRNGGSNGVGVVRLLDGGDLTFDTGATGAGQATRLTIDGTTGNATFAGNLTVQGADAITIPDYILHAGDDSKFGFPSNDNFKIRLAGSDLFTMSTTTATFAGSVKADGNIALGNISGVARLQHEGSGQLKMLSSGDSAIGTFTSTGTTFPSDIETTSSSKGLILKSPDGTRYRVTVANGGTLSVSAV